MRWSGRRFGRQIERRMIAAVENLERRMLLSAQPLKIVPHSQRPFTTFEIPAANTTLSPPFTPSEIQTAYDLDNITFNGVTGNGAGQTIAIIDAYDDPDLASDANSFSSTYGLPQFTIDGDGDGGPSLTIENEYGSTSNLPPEPTAGTWDAEESLDVEWAHTVAPEANILMVEGNSYSTNDFAQFIANETIAIDTAKATPGVSVVSMSWGVPLYSGETAIDSLFTSPSASQGITFFAAAGDTGTPEGYPADSPNVVGVGGISVTIDGDGSVDSETGWSAGGGGVSPYEPQPVWQAADARPFSTTNRTTPDVSWLADPNSGVVVLDTFYNSSPFQVGGTSLATPMWAALTSIADQGRALNGLPSLDGPTQTLPMLYTLPSSDFYDVTSGNNGLAAGHGYDLVTGLGTPIAPAIVSDMASATFVYVDSSAPAAGQTGASWANAYTSFQPVLASAPASREYVLVGQGTYVPGTTSAATFQLADNVNIIGGFAGFGASDPDLSGSAYTTTLSGILGNGQTAASVVTASGTDATAMLEGVTISDGSGADGSGLYDSGGDATFLYCQFTDDSATDGGAAYVINAAPTFLECTFMDDTATDGGAVYNASGSSATLSFCTFLTDSASIGGAVANGAGATPSLINCFYDGDTATTEGGGVANMASAALVFGGVFVGDSAPLGGGVANLSASPTITNCSFNANAASSDGGGMYDVNSSSPAVTNCIFWLDTAASGNEIYNADSGSVPVVTYSDVDGGYTGTVNINTDPLFVQNADPSAGN
ncbi:MAG TPA: S53 family peptidase, partial [Tepidisphaeraceae bacterium]|nr:S53 family peptidase [Tepidisphaeraceae bacterium]